MNKIIMIITMTFLILPIISMIIWSFFSYWSVNELLPKYFTLKGFLYFFKSGDWLVAFNTVIFSLIVAFISLVLSIMLSRFFIKSKFKYKLQLESLFYLPMLLPVVSVSIGSHKMFLNVLSNFGWLIIIILHIYFSLPYCFKIVYSCYAIWGIEEEQVARGLGASKFEAFYLINVPIYLKGYVSSFIMAFIISYSQYFINFFIGDAKFVNFSMIMSPYIIGSNRNISSVYTLMYIVFGVIVMLICSYVEKMNNNRGNVL